MRQSIARNALQRHSGAAAIPAMFLVSRGMSGSKLFVGGKRSLNFGSEAKIRVFYFLIKLY